MPSPTRRLGAAFEQLEDRALPSSFGVPWADPGHLTVSFAADGTATPAGPSGLFAALSPAGTTATWQREVLRAFQTWAVNANINVGLVADGGQALGTSGFVQGDARFGDIRVAGAPLAPDQVAFASPFSWTGTTFAGDVLFNSAQTFALGNKPSGFDLFSVALHEAGHVFGLDHEDHDTVMGAGYQFASALSADDIAALRSLYGSRTADAFDLKAANGTLATASKLVREASGAGRLSANADLTTTADVDFFQFQATTTSATVTLQAKGLSLLQARVSVFDAQGKPVASGAAVDLFNNDVTLQLTGLKAGGTYSVKVESAASDVFGVGSYRLTVDKSEGGADAPLASARGATTDGNDTLALATDLLDSAPVDLDGRFDITYGSAIESATDVDSYKVRAPRAANGGTVNMNVMVWSPDGALTPRVRVFDAAGKEAAFRVLANDAGLMSVTVENVSGRIYYIQVSARTPDGANGTGAYVLGADFNQSAQPLAQEFASNTLGASATTDAHTLDVAGAGVYLFTLSAEAAGKGAGGATLTATDAAGKVVFVLDATSGQPAVSVSEYLAAGTYTFKYTYHAVSGQPAGSIRYHVAMLKLSEGVGTYPPPPTSTAVYAAPATTTPTYAAPTTTTTLAPPTTTTRIAPPTTSTTPTTAATVSPPYSF